MNFQVIPISVGEFGMVRDDIKYYGGSPDIKKYVPSYIYLIQGEGEQYLVDTGFPDPEFCSLILQLDVKREIPLADLFQKYKIKAERVKGIFFTHLHWDHCGNINMFPNAKLYVQSKEYMAAQSESSYPPVFLEDLRQACESRDRLVLLDGDSEPVPGICVHLCGGHTAGSQMIEVRTAQGQVLIPGDVVMTMHNITGNIPVGLCDNQKEAQEALDYIHSRTFCRIYPSHE